MFELIEIILYVMLRYALVCYDIWESNDMLWNRMRLQCSGIRYKWYAMLWCTLYKMCLKGLNKYCLLKYK